MFISLGPVRRYITGPRMVLAVLIASVMLGGIATGAPSTPVATPFASPVASPGCDGLASYFQAVAGLVDASAGLAVLEEAGNDVLRLDTDEAALVVGDLNILIASIGEIAVPEPARAWRAAYLDLLRWYRDMAASSDPIALQRIINADRRLFVNLSTSILSGQVACPATWDPAWSAAFGD